LIDFITCRSVRARPSSTPGGGGWVSPERSAPFFSNRGLVLWFHELLVYTSRGPRYWMDSEFPEWPASTDLDIMVCGDNRAMHVRTHGKFGTMERRSETA
jgi:hypothetical protein